MLLYRFVWLYIFSYTAWKIAVNITHLRSSFSEIWSFSNESAIESQDKLNAEQDSKAYLVSIGSGANRYAYLYKPKSSILVFGGYRRDIFERVLLNLDIRNITTIPSNENMRARISRTLNQQKDERWTIYFPQRSKRFNNRRSELIHIRKKIGFRPFTIIFDIGDFSSEYLKTVLQLFAGSCRQYIVHNKKRVLANSQTINLVMNRAGYRRVTSVRSSYFATFVTSSLLKRSS